MLTVILLILIVFWFLGYGPISALKFPLIILNRLTISLWDILIFLVIIWIIDLLPRPLREIAVVVLIIWLLGIFGIIAIPMFNNVVIIALIAGLGLYLLSSGK